MLDLPIFEAFADDKFTVAHTVGFCFWTVENMGMGGGGGNRENAGYEDFLLIPQFDKGFQGCSSSGMLNISMGESNTVVSAYTLYRHLQQYCSQSLWQRDNRM